MTLSYCYDAGKDNIYISFLRPSDGAKYGEIRIDNLSYGHVLGERSLKLNVPEFGTVNMVINDSGVFDYEAILSIKFNDGTTINLPGMTKDGVSYYTTTIPFMKDRTSVRYVSDDGEDFTIRYFDFGLDKFMSSGKTFTIQGKQHKYDFVVSSYGSSSDQFKNFVYLTAVDGVRMRSSVVFDSTDPDDLSFTCKVKEDVNNLPDSKIWVTCSEMPELADSNNLYNFLHDYKELDLSKDEKWILDFSKVNDVIPLEKRQYYQQHVNDVNEAYNILYGSYPDDNYNLNYSLSYLFGYDITKLYNYPLEFDNDGSGKLIFDKETSGYTATEDFEFLMLVPDYVGDMKTRFNVAIPTGNTVYNPRLDSYSFVDNLDLVDVDYLASMLRYYLQLTIPAHKGEYASYACIESVLSQTEKTNIAEMFLPFMKGLDGISEFDELALSDADIDTYIDNIIANTDGIFKHEAEHLRNSLKNYNWITGFTSLNALTDASSVEDEMSIIDNYVSNLRNAGYTHNDFALMHLASAGALLGIDGDVSIDENKSIREETKAFYTDLVEKLGVSDVVSFTSLGIPKITLKAGETINFNALEDILDPESLPVLIYEKYYDDTESVSHRTYRLGVDKDGVTNVYAGGNDIEEPTTEPPATSEESTVSEELTTSEKETTVSEKPDNDTAKTDDKVIVADKKQNSTSNTEGVTKSVNTGDSNLMPVWFTLAGVSIAAMITGVVVYKRKKN